MYKADKSNHSRTRVVWPDEHVPQDPQRAQRGGDVQAHEAAHALGLLGGVAADLRGTVQVGPGVAGLSAEGARCTSSK
jgi:hypothetical protein